MQRDVITKILVDMRRYSRKT